MVSWWLLQCKRREILGSSNSIAIVVVEKSQLNFWERGWKLEIQLESRKDEKCLLAGFYFLKEQTTNSLCNVLMILFSKLNDFNPKWLQIYEKAEIPLICKQTTPAAPPPPPPPSLFFFFLEKIYFFDFESVLTDKRWWLVDRIYNLAVHIT